MGEGGGEKRKERGKGGGHVEGLESSIPPTGDGDYNDYLASQSPGEHRLRPSAGTKKRLLSSAPTPSKPIGIPRPRLLARRLTGPELTLGAARGPGCER